MLESHYKQGNELKVPNIDYILDIIGYNRRHTLRTTTEESDSMIETRVIQNTLKVYALHLQIKSKHEYISEFIAEVLLMGLDTRLDLNVEDIIFPLVISATKHDLEELASYSFDRIYKYLLEDVDIQSDTWPLVQMNRILTLIYGRKSEVKYFRQVLAYHIFSSCTKSYSQTISDTLEYTEEQSIESLTEILGNYDKASQEYNYIFLIPLFKLLFYGISFKYQHRKKLKMLDTTLMNIYRRIPDSLNSSEKFETKHILKVLSRCINDVCRV